MSIQVNDVHQNQPYIQQIKINMISNKYYISHKLI